MIGLKTRYSKITIETAIIILIIFACQAVFAITPWDVRKHWASREISQMVTKGIVTGFEDGSFRPDEKVTRAQFVKMLVLALGLEEEAKRLTGAPAVFADVPHNYWGKDYITLGWEMGIVKGDDEGYFHPEDTVNRMELTAMIIRAMGLEDSANSYTPDALRFEDTLSFPDWAKNYIAYAVKLGVVTGMPDNTFRPALEAGRAQAVVAVERMLQALGSLYDVEGVIERVDSGKNELNLETLSGDKIALKLASDIPVYLDRILLNLTALKKRQHVKTILDKNRYAAFIEISFPGQKVEGRVKTINRLQDYITIAEAEGDKNCYLIDDTLIISGAGLASPGVLAIGSAVEAVIDPETDELLFVRLK